MTCWRLLALVLLVIAVASADSPPAFTAAGLARGDRPAKSVVPGTYLIIYGTNLGPAPGQCRETRPQSTYPKEYCGTQVLLGDMPAELLYVSDKQINFKVPLDAPKSGTVDVRVVYKDQSSQPVTMRAGSNWVTVSLDGPAYTDMPVWLKIDVPFEGAVGYPSVFGPAGFGCNMVEARRNGQRLPLLARPDWAWYPIRIGGNICGPYATGTKMRSDRLPLHLLYRLDVPGEYEVRYTLRKTPPRVVPDQVDLRARSEWTPIQVLPAKPNQRAEWLQSIRNHPPTDPAELLTDTLPSLLGVPDDASFDILAGYIYHPDVSVRRYALSGLSYWPLDYSLPKIRALLKTQGPNDAITNFLAWRGAIRGDRH
ncbi:MAG TPA: IPT/TIG domain-containing protein [Bryobacteraceae bacterium]|nr:IPT/TIG domain-containing protein [Bryobacteraceae bacterium]